MSIVIPSYNDLPLLQAALDSIARTCSAFEYEVIVVDDYCVPANAEALRRLESERVTVVLKSNRVGFAGTVNAGMALASHDVVLLNSDIVALPGWLDALQRAAYEIDPLIGMVSPKLVYPSGRIQYGGTYYARILAPQWFGHLNVGAPATKPSANVGTWNRSVSGACVYIRRDALDTVGLLDDQYWLGFEDVDYGLRAWAAGYRCYYEPAAMLVHHESASRGYSQGIRELKSMRYFWRVWSDRFMTSRLPADAAVDFVVGSGSSPLWIEYVRAQVAALRGLGREVALHTIAGPGPDEELIRSIGKRDSVKIACDWTAGQTVWLSSTQAGKPVYLLPDVESGSFPDDPAQQAWIIANYKPEFDYIAPSRWVEDQLRSEAAWESRARIVPAIPSVEVADVAPPDAIVTVAASPATQRTVDGLASELGLRSVHVGAGGVTPTALEAIVSERPLVVVAPGEHRTSLPLLSLMGTGAALVADHNPRTRYEVLDGFNALLIAPGDEAALRRAVTDLSTDDQVYREIRKNGRDTAEHYSLLAGRQLERAIVDVCQTAI